MFARAELIHIIGAIVTLARERHNTSALNHLLVRIYLSFDRKYKHPLHHFTIFNAHNTRHAINRAISSAVQVNRQGTSRNRSIYSSPSAGASSSLWTRVIHSWSMVHEDYTYYSSSPSETDASWYC